MRISRYLEAKAFCDEVKKLKIAGSLVTEAVLERLEKQRSLVPHLRLHYPEEIERRWWAESHQEYEVGGCREPDGARWQAACELENARQEHRFHIDPTENNHPLDKPDHRYLQFMERPKERKFVPWKDYRVSVNANDAAPLYTSNTVITYYSSWQILQFAEVVNMGVTHLMNLLQYDNQPTPEEIAEAPSSMSFLPIYAMQGFDKHFDTLNAIIWFAEEAQLGYFFAVRSEHGRRLISDHEREDILRTRNWAVEQALCRHNVDAIQLLQCVRFLCEQWCSWSNDGRPFISDAYKTIASQGIQLARLATGKTFDEYTIDVGLIGGYFKPILAVIWPDWATNQRDDVRRILISYRQSSSLLQANFSDELVDRFLDFIDSNALHGFYWRMESFNRHSFKGNAYSLEGLKSDVQGMSVVLEHVMSALGASRTQLNEKFKELWANNSALMKLLKNNKVMKIGNGKTIDLKWFEQKNKMGSEAQTAADLAISYAIRGGAHRVIEETNPLKLEQMMLIMLRAAVKTFEAASVKNKANAPANDEVPAMTSKKAT